MELYLDLAQSPDQMIYTIWHDGKLLFSGTQKEHEEYLLNKRNQMNYEKFYIKPEPKKVPMDQLIQLVRIVSDGDLISKGDRDTLVNMGYACRSQGFNIITPKGIDYLYKQNRLSD